MTRDALDANLALLHQGLDLLDRLDDAAYRLADPGRSSVGAQYRHVLDHYRAFLDGLAEGRVDYDARRRDRAVETERGAAAADTRRVIHGLQALAGRGTEAAVSVIMSCTPDRAGDPRSSSLGRELDFLVSHTVHHYAIIRLLLAHPEAVDAAFGIAPSTLAWQRTTG